jgi:hypothetical protein
MSALADFSDQPEEDAHPLLEQVAAVPGPGRLTAQWVPDPGGHGLICAWTREPEVEAVEAVEPGEKGTDAS